VAKLIVMPKLSDTMEEGAIANWLKKEGEAIDEGQDLVEIETDKATMAFASSAEGIVLKILEQPGKALKLGAPICVIGNKGESFNLSDLVTAATAGSAKASPGGSNAKPAAAVTMPAASSQKATSPSANVVSSDRVKASPLARKIASDQGVNIASVQGSGPNGRVVARDLESVSGSASTSMRVSSSQVGVARADRTVNLTMMRKTIAKRLLAAKNDAPHFYLTVSCDMTRANEWRSKVNRDSDNTGIKVSVNDIVILAVSKALAVHPEINASWQGESITEFGSVHVAMAVALPSGLVTPVIRHSDQKSIRDIAAESRDLATKAKDGKLGNEDYAGGTFTISNLGMFGIEEFTAIINPPQAAILAVGATIPTPWVDAKGQVCVLPRMKMTLSCDHRVIDGAMGAQFLKTLVRYLEDPLEML
jgi:pyruvate dehydrogenase E2 component (dihydrolipoamide acetyltransferase)